MGSFNETCALSNLNIAPGTPVKLLFLTRNPYVKCDEHEDRRGCYHYDQWFARTPPIDGKYDDYGNATFEEGPLTQLISRVFDEDAVERPYGFNPYHAPPVVKGKGIHHYLEAASEGRLLVFPEAGREDEKPVIPENWPTWEKIHNLLSEANLPLQIDVGGKDGYNAIPVSPGVVCLNYEAYGDTSKKLAAAKKVLGQYDCKKVKLYPDRNDEFVLLVVPKGALKDYSKLIAVENVKKLLNTHPQYSDRGLERKLPVLAVMIRQDVWNLYLNLYNSETHSHPDDLSGTKKKIKNKYEEHRKINFDEKPSDLSFSLRLLLAGGFREVLPDLPFQTLMGTHLARAAETKDFSDKDGEDLCNRCAELARIEMIMSMTHQPWYIPPLGGQEGYWGVKNQLHTGLAALTKKIWNKEKREQE